MYPTCRGVQLAALCSVLLLAACEGDSQRSTTPLTPSAPSPLPSSSVSNLATWRANAFVLSATNPGRACGWGTTPGETRADVAWRITITGGSILLEEDMSNWPTDHIPFSGTLIGRQFTADYSNGANYLQFVCQFKGGTLTGTFSEDFSAFEAFETLVWGPPESETIVQRRWMAMRF